MMARLAVIFLVGCAGASLPEDSAIPSSERPWQPGLPDAALLEAPRGWETVRAIAHLHSPWSHDACDGQPLVDGQPDPDCLADLRAALCVLQIDAAYLSDHPEHAASQTLSALLHLREQDDVIEDEGAVVGAWMSCETADAVLLRPGSEGGLMPLALHAHPADTDSYGRQDSSAVAEHQAAGALVFAAHTEGRALADLTVLQDAGLAGVEVFNIHAMFDPNIRAEDLGLDGLGWLSGIAPFTDPDASAEPDLLFLGVLGEQAPSVASWDALQARGAMVGIGGSDAHQNVWPSLLRDGERGDSYRRMLRWMSNHLLSASRSPEDIDTALAAGRVAVVFEVLGSPTGLDVHLKQGDTILEMGARTAQVEGVLHVGCPSLAADSPQGPRAPEIQVTVYRNGAPWRDQCGDHPIDSPGVYRARFDIVPWHLEPFLGDDPDPWLQPWPWIYTNPITVTE